MNRTGTVVGLIGTGLYLAVLTWLLIDNWAAAKAMPLNNWGDFLSGAFAPLAFFWLVLGYFQQGEELRQNTAALKLQADQLEMQVKETQLLVQEAAAQAKASAELAALQAAQVARAERLAFPEFSQLTIDRPQRNVVIQMDMLAASFLSVGGRVTHLKVEADPFFTAIYYNEPFLEPGHTYRIDFHFPSGKEPQTFNFRVSYTDATGIRRATTFLVDGLSMKMASHGHPV